MPVEVAIKSEPQPRVAGYVKAGSYIYFPGFFTESGKIIGVHCLPDDSGGEIYAFEPIYGIEDYVVPTTTKEIYTPDRRIKTIDSGESYEQSVITTAGLKWSLVFTLLVSIKENE